LGTVVHERVRRKKSLDLPVTIGSIEEKLLKVSVLVDIFFFDEDRSLVLHISGR